MKQLLALLVVAVALAVCAEAHGQSYELVLAGGRVMDPASGLDAIRIPTYGCGHLDTAAERYQRALANNRVYREVWEPALRLPRAAMPVLWFTWLRDANMALTAQSACSSAFFFNLDCGSLTLSSDFAETTSP